MFSLMLHEVRVRRRTIIGWTIGLGFFGVVYMAFFPSLPEEMLNLDVESIDIYKSIGFRTMATFEGYMQSSVFNFLPLLVGAFGIVLGVGALAGEEDAGTIELLAALPISRLKLYAAKAGALILVAFLVMLAVALAVAAVFLAIESEIDTTIAALDLFGVVLSHWLMAFVFLSLGLFLGALLPSRGSALAVSAAVLVASYFGNNLAGMVTELESIQPLFPFHYFGRVTESITGDVPWDDVLNLVLMGVASLLLGSASFSSRDLTVGAWPWQRFQRGEASSRRWRPVVVTGCVTVVVATAITLAAIALINDGELRFGSDDSDDAATATSTLAATVEAVADDGTPTPDADLDDPTAEDGLDSGALPTATLRITR